MRYENIEKAKAEARRFLSTVDAYEQRKKHDAYFAGVGGSSGFKESGAVRRASLDLTRALAEMRKV